MLSEKVVAALAALAYRADADWEVNILPFGSIYWNDEMPAVGDLFDRPDDMAIIFAMFSIRLKLWDGEVLNTQDQELWNAVKHQVPQWALFRRLTLSDEQKLAREEAERRVEQEFESLGAEHDRKPRGWLAIGIFLLWGAAMATLAGITLSFPGTALDYVWVLNPKGHAGLTALGRWVGFLFPVLGLVLATAGIGWLKRRFWGWTLAVLLIGGNALGDAIRMVSGAWLEGAVGVVIAGALLFYLVSPRVRNCFR